MTDGALTSIISTLNPFAGGSPAEVRTGKIAVVLTLAGAPVGCAFTLMYLLSGAYVASASSLLATIGPSTGLWILWRTRSVTLYTHLLAAWSVVSQVGMVAVTGGGESLALAWFGTTPIIATLVGNLRTGFVWMTLSVATVLAIGVAQALGMSALNYMPESLSLAFSITSSVGLTVALYCIVWGFESARAEAMGKVEEAAEAAEQASRAKSAFLAHMSHEIRTPLSAILGYAELLDGPTAHDVDPAKVAATIRRNAKHLLAVINDVLDVSKIEAGRMTVESVPIDPVSVIEEVADLMRPLARAKGLGFEVQVHDDVPRWVLTDPTRLRQIVLNLCGNAIKYTAEGQVSVRVSAEREARRLEVAVRDTGIGMTPEQLESIRQFEAFNQADRSMARRFGGTGLGLRISQAFAVLLGGSIDITSTAGEGSTFVMTLAYGDATPPSAASSSPILHAAVERGLAGARILLVEDGPDNQRLFHLLLTREGAQVDVAEDGLAAVEAILDPASPPDLVLMDMQLPKLDGLGATARVREAGFTRPIVALTAHAMAEEREKALAAGCNDFVTKPVQRGVLIGTCERWLHGGCELPSQQSA